jgi:GAF domain-containing protein
MVCTSLSISVTAAHSVIEDASLDTRYADYSVVAGEPGVRFYAGYPIESPDGQRVGALCIMDTEPRHVTPGNAVLLRSLAQRVQAHLWRDRS